MNVTHAKGASCDYCFKKIGNPGSEIDTIYRLESELFPGQHLKLCRKDLDLYYEQVKQEREDIERTAEKIGIDALSPRQKRMYSELH
ncbi:hypothetical protein [Halobacillus naozhouensis]|uniref:Uncharacterized protein n=1 Tax=Halobacillus naozhouensis TaxID=554880 RepID=A0ABY8J6N8_9BACI|nr:hypothetical protein [Halobacillus naozhouensis]WFT77094.1 hypothetical protein P9989_21545 [Halobacillus naozhouensis]